MTVSKPETVEVTQACDFSRETMRANILAILKQSRDIHSTSLTDLIMSVIPRAAPRGDTETVGALQALYDSFKDLADSGDAGFWSLEDQPVGKRALAALEAARHRLNATPSRDAVQRVTSSVPFGNLRDLVNMQRTISHGTFAYAALIDLLAALSDTPPPDNEETEALRDAINKAAEIGYRVCAETRHVTLGDKVRNAILSAFNNGGK